MNHQCRQHLSSSSAPSSDVFTFTAPSNSGHTKEDGTTSTFSVRLKDNSHFPSTPPSPSSAPIGFCHSDPNNSSWYLAKTADESGWSSGDSCYTSSGSVTSYGGQSCLGGSGLTSCISACETAGINCNSSDFFTTSNISGNTSEDGTTSTFNVVLKSAPSSNVTVSVSSSNYSEGTVSPSSLTFTSNNWNTAQTVIVTGVDDSNSDGHQGYQISLSAITNCAINASNNVSPSGGTSGTQKGQSFTAISDGILTSVEFQNYYTTHPSAKDAYLKIREWVTDNDYNQAFNGEVLSVSGGIVSGPSNSSNWQDLTLFEFDDPVELVSGTKYVIEIVGGLPYTKHGNPYSGGKAYETLNPQSSSDFPFITRTCASKSATVELHNLDNDINVTVDVASRNTLEATVNPSILTFTPNNWQNNQTVTVTGVDDIISDGHKEYQVSLSIDDLSDHGTGSGSSSQSTVATQPPLQDPSSSYNDTSNKYVVSTLGHLSFISQNTSFWSKNFIQTANIDATVTKFWDDADDAGGVSGDRYNDNNDLTSAGNNEGFFPMGTTLLFLLVNMTVEDIP